MLYICLMDMQKTIWSGGAEGADKLWVEEAIKHGYKGHHILPSSTKRYRTPQVSYYKLSEEHYAKNWSKVLTINNQLNRGFPETYPTYIKKLLARNVSIIDYADAVYAVGYIDHTYTMVLGGTGWGIAQAIMDNKPVYVFDQHLLKWFSYDYDREQSFVVTFDLKITETNIAGVGSRKLLEASKNAIKNIFK